MANTAQFTTPTLEALIVALRDLERVTLATLSAAPRDTVVYFTLTTDGGGTAVLSYPRDGDGSGSEVVLAEWFTPSAALPTIQACIRELEARGAAT